jgi:ribosomal protein L7/L12
VSVTVWIVVAFVVGVLFGRLTARGSGTRAGGPTGVNSGRASGFAAGAAIPVVGSPNGAYRVILLDSGPNKINSIKAVREITRLDLKNSKDLVDAAPRELIRVESAAEAEAIARRFQGVASVRVEGPAGTPTSAGSGYVPGGVQ